MASSFNTAFAKARKAGKKIFTWEGKQYNTKVAKTNTPAKMKAPGSKPSRLPETVKVPGNRPGSKSAQSTPRSAPEASIKDGIKKAAQKSGASRSTKGKVQGMGANPDLTIGSRIKRSIRIGENSVNRGRRRDAAEKANKGAADAVSKMLKGMGTRPKKKKAE